MGLRIHLLLTTLFTQQFAQLHAENILFLLPISSKSHKNVYDPLINALAEKGHNLTIVSSVNSSYKLPSVHEIVPVTSAEVFAEFLNPFEARKLSTLGRITQGADHWITICHKVYQNEDVQGLLKNGKFDLVIVNGIGNNCFYGMIPSFNAPSMALLTLPASNFNTERLGTHLPPSHVPMSFLDLTERMNFKQRTLNTVIQWLLIIADKLYYTPLFGAVKTKYHGEDWPELGTISRNFSMLLVNSHLSMNPLLPLLPDIVEVGGMHCRPAKPLKQVS
jgi:glucuronosyltransferase